MILTYSIAAPSSRIGEQTFIKQPVLGPNCDVCVVSFPHISVLDDINIVYSIKLENIVLSRSMLVEEWGQLKDHYTELANCSRANSSRSRLLSNSAVLWAASAC
ncbi:hypothetical protein BS47DRAFT_365752 [Hydnum rufescens UP504]|uniref:Uncharacterized protein n=1 Tax=Hydnum rufescens UP504 TaxID=1448309 RepID=A0A9P6AJL4_9AGAM|nr:hypothetical protein BS47DRAFT_365752 [Hydnum rufescens UP504]